MPHADGWRRGARAGHDGPVDGVKGRLLLSSPSMSDVNFDRTVVFMLEHSTEGALGVVINRPAPIAVADAVPQWAPFVGDPPVVFVGGPVAPGSVLVLGRAEAEHGSEAFSPVLSTVGVVDATSDPTELDVGIVEARLFTGYAGWAPGQLERELEGGGWFVIDANPEDPFAREPEGLWAEALKRDTGVEAMRDQHPRRHWLN
jgi:putative transcriptional regulator